MNEQKIDEARLASIEARAREATPGPWEHDIEGNYIDGRGGTTAVARLLDYDDISAADGAFIVAARTDVPDLIADLRLERSRIEAALVLCRAEIERNKSMHSTATDGFAFQVALALTGGKR